MAALGDQIIEPAVVLSAHGQPVLVGLRPQLLTACIGTSGLGVDIQKHFGGELYCLPPQAGGWWSRRGWNMFCRSGRGLVSALVLPLGSISILKLGGVCAEPLALSLGSACAKPAVVVVRPHD